MPKIYANKKTGQLVLTLPRAICKAKSWRGGTELELVIDNVGQVILRPKLTVV